MKTATGILGILILCSGAALAQSKPTAAADEAAIRAIEEKWDAASVKGDAAALGAILADTFVSTNAEGKIRNKTEFIAPLKSGEIKFQSAKADELKITVYGDAAVVTGRWRGKFVEKGKPVDATERFTDVFIRQNGQWRVVSSHVSNLK